MSIRNHSIIPRKISNKALLLETFIISCILLFTPGAAYAALSTAGVTLWMEDFTIRATNSIGGFMWRSEANAWVSNSSGDFQSAADSNPETGSTLYTKVLAQAQVTSSDAWAFADLDALAYNPVDRFWTPGTGSQINATSYTVADGTNITYAWGASNSTNTLTFTLVSSSSISVSVPYTAWNELEGVNASGQAGARLVLGGETDDCVIDEYTESLEGLLSVVGDFDPGTHELELFLWSESEASTNVVPIPGALWLLGSGLIGLVGMRRLRK